jgi:hypothetical protein
MNTNLPETTELYRFTTFERLLDHIVNKRFTFLKYKLFDDQWEGFYHKGFHKINEHDSYSVLGENRPFIMCFTKRIVSEAMWRIYSRDSRGVQIVTNVGRLKNLVAGCCSEFDCHLREVIYDDEIEKDDFFVKNFPKATMQEKAFECLFRKRRAFDHEEEVRLVLYSPKDRPDSDLHFLYCDPNEVIQRVILDPRIDKRTEDLQIMTIQKLGFSGKVAKSSLYTYKRVWYKT